MAVAYIEFGEEVAEHGKKNRFHKHEYYEIMYFYEANAKMYIEEKIYTIEPGDVIVTRTNEQHRLQQKDSSACRRLILTIYPEFFIANDCQEYEAPFLDHSKERISKISADKVKYSGLHDALMRYKEYSTNHTVKNVDTFLRALVIEILFLTNRCFDYVENDCMKESMKPIIRYIDANYYRDISLEQLCNLFYISKSHLCRAFRESTGMTIYQYIQKRRLIRVRDFSRAGVSMNVALAKSGFHNYTAYYRAYKKEYGKSPSKGMD